MDFILGAFVFGIGIFVGGSMTIGTAKKMMESIRQPTPTFAPPPSPPEGV